MCSSNFVYVCVCVFFFVCGCTRVCAYLYTQYTQLHTCVDAMLFMCVCVCFCLCLYDTYMCVSTYYINTYIYIYVDMYVYEGTLIRRCIQV